ncbi:hypothetical protein BU26DRAFT_121911 [Trematosphaeria pertusa]|uniref:Uncharacterized protein n=1 Tax=Trematosphaeria pertusa TaxID=390896 RepID=A0A6A6HYS7_9PLEO|nr:uncharacterized protein BU26DRAFT_121911 [Trematosphaeria pertusa]KAF2242938.1 hypothetical protein BU26DRAFT_121911 [Trematosphaeria pertusa]
MTTLLNITPLDPEPLPLYSRNDPDAVSIRSAAPSYVSETPTYHSERAPPSLLPPLSPNQQVRGLPAPRYAPGFQSRAMGSISDINNHNFNTGSWSSTRTSNNSRQYNAVARRRANQARAETTAILNSLSAVPPPLERSGSGHSPTSSSTDVSTYPVQVGSSSDPFSPLEDPYLVGEVAANRARAQRVYREMCLRGEEASRYESRSWDFMWGQMADWEERDRSWTNFRKRVGPAKMLGRRLGLRAGLTRC